MASLEGCAYPIVVLTEGNYELGKIKWVYEHTDIDEFLLLQDTCVVKDISFIDRVFSMPESVCLTDVPDLYGCYLGKYRREVLEKLQIPVPKDKYEAVKHETEWTRKYAALDPPVVLFDDLDKPPYTFVEHHGRLNIRLENDYLIKYKGSWSYDTIKEG